MKKRVAEMEAEAEKLRQMQAEVEKEMNLAPAADGESKDEVDGRSVYVGNVRSFFLYIFIYLYIHI